MQGEGLGRLEGKIVFVPFTLPGESVEIEIKEERKTYSRGRLVRVLEPSPDRVTPPCPVFGICGGCHLQHASPSAQSRIKENGFREAFRHALKMDDPPIQTLRDSPGSLYYRHRLRLKIQGRDRQSSLGFYQARSHQLVAVERCFLANPAVNRILSSLSRVARDIPFLGEPADLEIQCLEEGENGLVLLRVPRRPSTTILRRVTEKLLEIQGIKAVFFGTLQENGLFGLDPYFARSAWTAPGASYRNHSSGSCAGIDLFPPGLFPGQPGPEPALDRFSIKPTLLGPSGHLFGSFLRPGKFFHPPGL